MMAAKIWSVISGIGNLHTFLDAADQDYPRAAQLPHRCSSSGGVPASAPGGVPTSATGGVPTSATGGISTATGSVSICCVTAAVPAEPTRRCSVPASSAVVPDSSAVVPGTAASSAAASAAASAAVQPPSLCFLLPDGCVYAALLGWQPSNLSASSIGISDLHIMQHMTKCILDHSTCASG